MLHVEVYIPAVMKNYEFSLNEHVKTAVLIEEMAHMISQSSPLQIATTAAIALLLSAPMTSERGEA